MRALRVGLFCLLALRLVVSVVSQRGIGWDFPNYYNAAGRIVHGQSQALYDSTGTIGGQPPLGDRRQIYYGVPLSAQLFAPLGLMEPKTAVVIFKAVCALCYILGLVLLYRSLQRALNGRPRADLVLTAYLTTCLLFAPFWFTFEVGGQATAINFLLLVLFYRTYVAGNTAGAAWWFGLGVLVKPVLAPMGLIFVFASEWRLVRDLVMVGLLLGLASVLLMGWPLHEAWLALVRRDAAQITIPWWNNASLAGMFYNLWYGWRGDSGLEATTAPSSAFQALNAMLKLLLIGLFFWLVRQTKREPLGPYQRRHHLAMLSLVFALLFSNIVWPHYLAFLFLPLAFALPRADRLARGAAIWLWLIVLSVLSVESRFAQRFILGLLDGERGLQALFASLFGGCTLLLLVVFLLRNNRALIRSQNDLFATAS